MKINTLSITCGGALVLAAGVHALPSKSITLTPWGSYASGQFDAGAAEIVAHDPETQQIFVVNAKTAEIDVLSIAEMGIPGKENPVKVGAIDLKPHGAVANSVAVRGGLIAVAVEASPKTDPGKVLFFDRGFNLLASVQVGSLPDMVTFTPNGRYVLVANEGEPSNDYTIDPPGTVSIIDLSGPSGMNARVKTLNQSRVRSVGFSQFNNQQLDPSIRIFGPNSSVAQDLEPEYITVSHDSKMAWVTLQENNALAIIDITSATATKLVGLGFKDHSAVKASCQTYDFSSYQLPSIGRTIGGQNIALGGFSGLAFEGIDPATGRYKFVAHTDRGPNAEPTGDRRPFLLPSFTPEVVRFELDRGTRRFAHPAHPPARRAGGAADRTAQHVDPRRRWQHRLQ